MGEETPYSPEALGDLIDKIARKAIQTTLDTLQPLGWEGTPDSGFTGSGWEGTLPPVTGPAGRVTLRVTHSPLAYNAAPPPGSVIVGDEQDPIGNPVTIYELDPWADLYQPWIERVRGVFEKWLDIPRAWEFNKLIEKSDAAANNLVRNGGTPGSRGAANVDLVTSFKYLDKYVVPEVGIGTTPAERQAGALVSAFDTAYGLRVEPVMANQAIIASALSLILKGEKGGWAAAGKDLMKIAQATEAGMKPGGTTQGFDLEALQFLMDLVGDFLPPGVQGAIDKGLQVAQLVESITPDARVESSPSVTLEGSNPEQLLASAEEALKNLDLGIYDQERQLAEKTAEGALNFMYESGAQNFHIHPSDGIDIDTAAAAELNIDVPYANNVGYVHLPAIAAHMCQAAELAHAATNCMPFLRTSVGYGTAGAYFSMAQLQMEFDRVTTGSAAELVAAGEIYAQGATKLGNEDEMQRRALRGLQDTLNRGEDGWSRKPQPTPPQDWMRGGQPYYSAS